MARVTTLTSKGQVTVPKEIRDELGLKPHDKVEIFLKNGHAWLRKVDAPIEDISGSSSPREPETNRAIATAKEAPCDE